MTYSANVSSTSTSSRASRGPLAYFEASDWSEDLEESLNSFRSLRDALNEFDEAEETPEPGTTNPTDSPLHNDNDEDAADDADEDDEDDEESASSGAVRVPDEFICPLTLSVMRDPVVSKFGHSYERDAILGWLVEHRQTCPLTRKPLSLGGIITNHQLRGKIRKWQLENELDITVLCNASDVMMTTTDPNDVSKGMSTSMSRLGGFYIVPDLDDTERSTDDEDEDATRTSARPASSGARRAGGSGSRSSTRQRSRISSDASHPSTRRASRNNYRLVSGISRRIFGGGRPAAA